MADKNAEIARQSSGGVAAEVDRVAADTKAEMGETVAAEVEVDSVGWAEVVVDLAVELR